MNYQTVASKISEFIGFKAQIQQMKAELENLQANPPRIENDVLTWEEAVAYAENEKAHAEQIQKLTMGIANREGIVQNKEQEIGEMLPVKEHYILFELKIDEQNQTFKIGYFPNSYGFRMEKVEIS
jgi:multidrug resistance efflux pump